MPTFLHDELVELLLLLGREVLQALRSLGADLRLVHFGEIRMEK